MVGGSTWVIWGRAHRYFNKNPILIIFYNFVHQLPAPSAPEGGTLYLLLLKTQKVVLVEKTFGQKKLIKIKTKLSIS